MSPRAELEYLLNRWQSRVETILSAYHKAPVRLRLRPDDRLRLFNLRVWCERYCVTPEWLILFLVGYWRRRSPVKGAVFSCRLSTFAGRVSQQAVETEIVRLYPNGENIKARRNEMKMQMIGFGISSLRVSDPLGYVEAYRIQLEKNQRKLSLRRFTRRRFRGNPFVLWGEKLWPRKSLFMPASVPRQR